MTMPNEKRTIDTILSDTELMADRGRLAVIDERLERVISAIREECRVLRDTFSSCAEMGATTWPHMEGEQASIDRVRKLYALQSERSMLTQRREDLARHVMPRLARL